MSAALSCEDIATALEAAFSLIERCIPPPKFVQMGTHWVFRYEEPNLKAAIIQKTARLVSGINALLLLKRGGYVQEIGVLCRTLDELGDDVVFLCQASSPEATTDLHREYLENFYQEEFDVPGNPFLSSQKRPTVPRKKIHAALARVNEQALNPSDGKEIRRTLSQAYSGFVHAASAQVMDMYGGDPPRFHVAGMLGTPRDRDMLREAWTYTYRGLLTVMFVCHFFGLQDLLAKLYEFRNAAEQSAPFALWSDPQEAVRKMKADKPVA
jgi:hypothetical protein